MTFSSFCLSTLFSFIVSSALLLARLAFKCRAKRASEKFSYTRLRWGRGRGVSEFDGEKKVAEDEKNERYVRYVIGMLSLIRITWKPPKKASDYFATTSACWSV
jgi:hypothetical protein